MRTSSLEACSEMGWLMSESVGAPWVESQFKQWVDACGEDCDNWGWNNFSTSPKEWFGATPASTPAPTSL